MQAIGKDGKVPGVTATPTVPGGKTEQWMCATVVVPVSPEQMALTINV